MTGDRKNVLSSVLFIGLVLSSFLMNCYKATSEKEKKSGRKERVLGIFSVVRFPNSVCVGPAGLNGTCYTSEECTSKGGSSDGSCAQSFGVCCIFSMGCGSTTSENCTYHSITTFSTTTDASPCTYTICRMNTNICKLRLDFTAMTISGPFTMAADDNTNPDAIQQISAEMAGRCIVDTFTVTSPGNAQIPTLCGYNTGQHMYVPTTDTCNLLNFNIDKGTTATRSWNIKVTQHDCCTSEIADQECLQYFTGPGPARFSSFNYNSATAAAPPVPATNHYHLANQHYDICFRRNSGMCGICFSQEKAGSFGVSGSNVAILDKSKIACPGVENDINADYILIPGMTTSAIIASITTPKYATICGPKFNSATNLATTDTVCSFKVPFRMGVHFDGKEIAAKGTNILALNARENNHGALGFDLVYWQVSC